MFNIFLIKQNYCNHMHLKKFDRMLSWKIVLVSCYKSRIATKNFIPFRFIALVPPAVIHPYALFSCVQDFVRLQAQFSIEVWK